MPQISGTTIFTGPMEIRFKNPILLNCIILREDFSNGQHCKSFKLLMMDEKNNEIKEIVGTTIGRKRIITFPTASVSVIKLLTSEKSGTVPISEIEAYLIDEKLIEK